VVLIASQALADSGGKALVLAGLAKTEAPVAEGRGNTCRMHYRMRINQRKGLAQRLVKSSLQDFETEQQGYQTRYTAAGMRLFQDSSYQIAVIDTKKLILYSRRKQLPSLAQVGMIQEKTFALQRELIAASPIQQEVDSLIGKDTCRLVVFQRLDVKNKPLAGQFFGYLMGRDSTIRAYYQYEVRGKSLVAEERITHIIDRQYSNRTMRRTAAQEIFRSPGRLRKAFKGYLVKQTA
jgi:hypothetical protein